MGTVVVAVVVWYGMVFYVIRTRLGRPEHVHVLIGNRLVGLRSGTVEKRRIRPVRIWQGPKNRAGVELIGGCRDSVEFRPIVWLSFPPYFFARPSVAVILLVLIRSPIYFCKNRLLLSSLSCSSLTLSMRWNIMSRESCRTFDCLFFPQKSFVSNRVSQQQQRQPKKGGEQEKKPTS